MQNRQLYAFAKKNIEKWPLDRQCVCSNMRCYFGILNEFGTDIYGDDALYTKARIYDYTLKDPEAAMKFYLEFLTQYPGSLYSVEVRKRIRALRQG